MSSSKVTYRDDGTHRGPVLRVRGVLNVAGTKVTVNIEGNVQTTVYEKDGHIRREKIFLESESEYPQRRAWGLHGGASHSAPLTPAISLRSPLRRPHTPSRLTPC